MTFEKSLWLSVRRQVQKAVGRVPSYRVSRIRLGLWRFSAPGIPKGPLNPGDPLTASAYRIQLSIDAGDELTAKAIGWHWILSQLWFVEEERPMIVRVRARLVEPWEGNPWAMAANLAMRLKAKAQPKQGG